MKQLSSTVTVILAFLIAFSSFSQTYKVDDKKMHYWDQTVNLADWKSDIIAQNSYDNGENFKVFPNPTPNVLNISSSNIIDKMEVYDVLGKKIMQSSNTKQLNVEYLKSGIYLLKVFSNNRSTTKKIVIN